MVQVGDVTIQDQADRLPVNSVGTFSHDLTAATGTQAVTGVGFKPSAVILIGAVDNDSKILFQLINEDFAYGACGRYSITAGDWETATAFTQTAPNRKQLAHGASSVTFQSDGFTLSWTKSGSPTGNAAIRYMAFK